MAVSSSSCSSLPAQDLELEREKKPQLPISNTPVYTVPQESWVKSPEVCAWVYRPFRPSGHESVKGLAHENRHPLWCNYYGFAKIFFEIEFKNDLQKSFSKNRFPNRSKKIDFPKSISKLNNYVDF